MQRAFHSVKSAFDPLKSDEGCSLHLDELPYQGRQLEQFLGQQQLTQLGAPFRPLLEKTE